MNILHHNSLEEGVAATALDEEGVAAAALDEVGVASAATLDEEGVAAGSLDKKEVAIVMIWTKGAWLLVYITCDWRTHLFTWTEISSHNSCLCFASS